MKGVNTNFFYSPIGLEHDEVRRTAEELGVRLLLFLGGGVSKLYDWETGRNKPKDLKVPGVARIDSCMERAQK